MDPFTALVCWCWVLVTWGGMYWYPWFVKTNTPVFFAFSTWAFSRTDAALPISGHPPHPSPARETSQYSPRDVLLFTDSRPLAELGEAALSLCHCLLSTAAGSWTVDMIIITHSHIHNNTCLCCRRLFWPSSIWRTWEKSFYYSIDGLIHYAQKAISRLFI